MQFCNFRMALFVFFSRIHHRSLITLFLFVVFTCLPSSFGALVPADGMVSSLLMLHSHVSCADAVSPFLFSIGCFAVRGVAICGPAEWNGVRYSWWEWCSVGCPPGGNAASQGSNTGRSSALTVRSTLP